MLLTDVCLRHDSVFFIKDSNQETTKKNTVMTKFVLPFARSCCILCSYDWGFEESKKLGHMQFFKLNSTGNKINSNGF